MIQHTYLNNVQVDNANRYLVGIRDSSSANIDLNSYDRGGRSGLALSTPFYRAFAIVMEWVIVGSSNSDLVTQKDAFLKLWNLNPISSGLQTKILGFQMSNGVIKQVPVIVSQIRSDIMPENINHVKITIAVRSELEYFANDTLTTEEISIYQGGGMAIPMALPMDMSDPLSGQALVINNSGNAEYYPTIRVYGDFTSFSILNQTTNMELFYNDALAVDEYVDIDMYNRTVLFMGTTNVLSKITGDFWSITPGDNELYLIAASGAGYAEITYSNAYRGV